MRYTVVLHRSEEGISVSVPGLPGCWSEGDTEDEALEDIRDAIREYLAARDDLTRGAGTRELEVAVSSWFSRTLRDTGPIQGGAVHEIAGKPG
jgi:predicted RNase H-like HicB family nuclease